MASLSKTENITLENISDLVRSKQQELNNFHDLQIQQLEKGIDDRNKLLSEASRKFNLLKDDFQYNLTLLEARDVEIQRLSQVEVNLLNEIEFKENEIKILAQKYDKLQTKERENYHKYQEERSKTKKFLLELQEEAESLRWSTNEETNQKNKEIEHLKVELHRAHLERKDALDVQRLELTRTYEALLQSKEDEFLQKESEISQQIVGLENRFQHLTSDNIRLKTELSTLLRKNEKLTQLVSEKEDKCLQLEWSVSDKERERQDGEDQLHRRIQSLEAELNSSLATIEQMKLESKRDLDKARTELKRDQEYAQLKIQHWEELYQNSSADIEKLEKQLVDLQTVSHSQKKELECLRSKLFEVEELKSNLMNTMKLTENKTEYNERVLTEKLLKLEQESREATKEIDELRSEREKALKDLQEREEKMKLFEQESMAKVTNLRLENEEKMRALVLENEKSREVEREILRADLEAQYITQLSDHESEMSERMIKMKELNEKLNQELSVLRNEKRHLEELYEEEKTESGALRLRIQLLTNSQPQQQTQQQQQQSYKMNNVPPPGPPKFPPQSGGIALPSPMFSDDMGLLSIPGSPSTPFSPRFQSGKHFPSLPPTRESTEDVSKSEFQFNETLSSFGNSDNDSPSPKRNQGGGAGTGAGEPSEAENKKLKGIIREMRQEMESMQSEMSMVLNEKQEAINRSQELESRLQNSIAEVNRLRTERKRLMDLNNELRSNLHKQRMEYASLGESQQSLPPPTSVTIPAEESSPLQLPSPVISSHSHALSATGKALKLRASDRQTPSQEAALVKLKEKTSRANPSHSLHSSHPGRRVVNYARQENFTGML